MLPPSTDSSLLVSPLSDAFIGVSPLILRHQPQSNARGCSLTTPRFGHPIEIANEPPSPPNVGQQLANQTQPHKIPIHLHDVSWCKLETLQIHTIAINIACRTKFHNTKQSDIWA
ncbi:hypothetical protein Zmor_028348 [Zophobas morio]|uniref:Uncharacterized protein n=1 Tax=Zophobas morio TaxID=2755281 RepID=A0AA38HQD5_9CUCU|nr:hypothetical protein Zmor_028348 [Zophobas morio]